MALSLVKEAKKRNKASEASTKNKLTNTHKLSRSRKNTKIELKPYQRQILDELSDHNGVALFMKTGTGKTYTALFKMLDIGVENLLIQCPSRVVKQWEKSAKEIFTDYDLIEFKKSWTGKKKDEYLKKLGKFKNNILVVPYEVGVNMRGLPNYIDSSWGIIFDESHKLRNSGNKSTRMALRLSRKTKYKAILTATPVQGPFGGYIEYYNQLKIIDAIKINLSQFKEKYAEYEYIEYASVPFPIPELKGYKNTKEIDDILKEKSRSAELPYGVYEPVHDQIIIDELSPLYNQLLSLELPKGPLIEKSNKPAAELIFKHDNDDVIVEVNSESQRYHMKKMLCSGVIKDSKNDRNYTVFKNGKIKWLQDFIEDTNDDERILVFYQYVAEKEQLEDMLKDKKIVYSLISGGQNTEEKLEAVSRTDTKVILAQLDSSSESIDGLQYRTHIAVYYSLPKSSITYRQSLGRIDRIGQTKAPYYIFLTTEGTIEGPNYELMKNNTEFNELTLRKLLI